MQLNQLPFLIGVQSLTPLAAAQKTRGICSRHQKLMLQHHQFHHPPHLIRCLNMPLITAKIRHPRSHRPPRPIYLSNTPPMPSGMSQRYPPSHGLLQYQGAVSLAPGPLHPPCHCPPCPASLKLEFPASRARQEMVQSSSFYSRLRMRG